MQSDTIAAISTPLMAGGIGIIRISGDDARTVASRVFKCAKKDESLLKTGGYTAKYGFVYDNDERIDEAVALVYIAPHSYTGEDVVELSCHGGPFVMKQVLRAVLSAGARQADAGEFSKRAFLNSKMTLTQAEAVMDIISASNTQALQSANSTRSGAVYKKISALKEKLVYCAAQIAAFVDFPEEGLEEMDETGFMSTLKEVKLELNKLIAEFNSGAVLRHGIDCVIAGRPNVGKSTLMNLLAKYDRSIVTSHAGTTRDIVEETVELDGILLRLSDTAGIRDGSDEVEKIGIQRAKQKLSNAQLVLAVFDGSNPLTEGDYEILDSLKDRSAVLIINKTDLGIKIDVNALEKYGQAVIMSAIDGKGLKELKKAVLERCGANMLNPNEAILANERQLSAAKRAADALETTINDIENGQTLDTVGVMLEDSISALLELTGEKISETVVGEVFSKFCVGK